MTLGELNYITYCKARDWKSVSGEPLPEWRDTAPAIRDAWDAAALAVGMQAFLMASDLLKRTARETVKIWSPQQQ